MENLFNISQKTFHLSKDPNTWPPQTAVISSLDIFYSMFWIRKKKSPEHPKPLSSLPQILV